MAARVQSAACCALADSGGPRSRRENACASSSLQRVLQIILCSASSARRESEDLRALSADGAAQAGPDASAAVIETCWSGK